MKIKVSVKKQSMYRVEKNTKNALYLFNNRFSYDYEQGSLNNSGEEKTIEYQDKKEKEETMKPIIEEDNDIETETACTDAMSDVSDDWVQSYVDLWEHDIIVTSVA